MNEKIIFWWPDSIFLDVHWKKDPGSIPIELKLLGYDVNLVVGKFNSNIRYNGINVIETSKVADQETINTFKNRITGLLTMLKIVHKYDPKSVIIEHSEFEAILFAALLKLYTKFTLKFYPSLILKLDVDPDNVNPIDNRFIETSYRYIFTRLFDRIVCESECAYDELIKPNLIQQYKDKYIIVPNGFFNNKEHEKNVNVQKRNIILSVGRIHPQKGHDILISIFSKLAEKFPDWELRIVGSSDDKTYMNILKKQINDLNLNKSIKLITDLSDEDLIIEYKQASIFALLSRSEGSSISRIEAINYALPIVITEAGCGTHYKKFDSLVCNINDEECLIKSLCKLISNPDLRNEISERQKGAILSWHDVALEFAKLIENKE